MSKKFCHALKVFFLCIMTALSSVSNVTVVAAEEDQKTDRGGVRVSLSVANDKTTAEPGTPIVVHVDAQMDQPIDPTDTASITITGLVSASSIEVNDSTINITDDHLISFDLDSVTSTSSFDITVNSDSEQTLVIQPTVEVTSEFSDVYDVVAEPLTLVYAAKEVAVPTDQPVTSPTPIVTATPGPTPTDDVTDAEESEIPVESETVETPSSTQMDALTNSEPLNEPTNESPLNLTSSTVSPVQWLDNTVIHYHLSTPTAIAIGELETKLVMILTIPNVKSLGNLTWDEANNQLTLNKQVLMSIPNVGKFKYLNCIGEIDSETDSYKVKVEWNVADQLFSIDSDVDLNIEPIKDLVATLVDTNSPISLSFSLGNNTQSNTVEHTFVITGGTPSVSEQTYSVSSTEASELNVYWVDNNQTGNRPSPSEMNGKGYQLQYCNVNSQGNCDEESATWINGSELVNAYPGLTTADGNHFTLSNVTFNSVEGESRYVASVNGLPTTITISNQFGTVRNENLKWRIVPTTGSSEVNNYNMVHVTPFNEGEYESVAGAYGVYYILTETLEFDVVINAGDNDDLIDAIRNLLINVPASQDDGGFYLDVTAVGGTVSPLARKYTLKELYESNALTITPSNNGYTIQIPNAWQYNINGMPMIYSVYRDERYVNNENPDSYLDSNDLGNTENILGDDHLELVYDNSGVVNVGSVTVGGHDNGQLIFTLRGDTEFTATKLWQDQGLESANRPQVSFELLRYRKGESYLTAAPVRDDKQNPVIVEIEENDTDEYVITPDSIENLLGDNIEHLAKYDPEGYPYVYFLRETIDYSQGGNRYVQQFGRYNDETGEYEGDVHPDGQRPAGDSNIYNDGVVTNVLEDSVLTPLKKIWNASSFQANLSDVTITFQLQVKTVNGTDQWEDVDGQTVVMSGFTSEQMGQTITNRAYPKYNNNHEELQYRWVETSVTQGALTQQVKYRDTDAASEGSFTLNLNGVTTEFSAFATYENANGDIDTTTVINQPSGTLSYEIQKFWEDENGALIANPDDVALFHLYQISPLGEIYKDPLLTFQLDGQIDTSLSSKTVTIGNDVYEISYLETESYVFEISGLPNFDSTGGKYGYLLIEVDEQGNRLYPGMETTTNENGDYHSIVTNGPGELHFVNVQKKWIDDSDITHRETVILGVYTKDTKQRIAYAELNESNEWLQTVGIGTYTADQVFVIEESVGGHGVVIQGTENVVTDPNYLEDPFAGSSEQSRIDYVSATHHRYDVSYSMDELAGDPIFVVTNRRLGNIDITVHKTWMDGQQTARSVFKELSEQHHISPAVRLVFDDSLFPVDDDYRISYNDQGGYVSLGGSRTNILDSEGNIVSSVQKLNLDQQSSEVYFFNLPKYNLSGGVAHYTVEEGFLIEDANGGSEFVLSENIKDEIKKIVYDQEELNRYLEITDQMELDFETDYQKGHTGETSEDDINDVQTITLTNRLNATVNVTWYKIWKDNYVLGNGNRPDIYLNIYRVAKVPNEDGTTTSTPELCIQDYQWNRTPEDSDPNQWEVTLKDVDKYNEYGYEYTYYAVERSLVNTSALDYDTVQYYADLDMTDPVGQMTPDAEFDSENFDSNWTIDVTGILNKDDPTEIFALKAGGTFVNQLVGEETFEASKLWSDLPKDFVRSDLPSVEFTMYQYSQHQYDAETGEFEGYGIEVAKITVNNWYAVYNSNSGEYTFPIEHLGNYSLTYDNDNNQYVVVSNGQDPLRPIPRYDAEGNHYYYQLKETNVFYNDEYQGNELFDITYEPLNTFILTNKFTGHDEIEITLQKWIKLQQSNNVYVYPALTFGIYRTYTLNVQNEPVFDDTPYSTFTISSNELKRLVKDQTSDYVSFIFDVSDYLPNDVELNQYAPNGVEYRYKVVELTNNLYGYEVKSALRAMDVSTTAKASKEIIFVDDNNQSLLESDDTVDGTFFNIPNQDYVNIQLTKNWVDNNNQLGIRPESNNFVNYLSLWRSAPSQPGQGNAIEEEQVMDVIFSISSVKGSSEWVIDVKPQSDDKGFEKYAPNGMYWNYTVKEVANQLSPYEGKVTKVTSNLLSEESGQNFVSFKDSLLNSLVTEVSFGKRFVDEQGKLITDDFLGEVVTVDFELQFTFVSDDPNAEYNWLPVTDLVGNNKTELINDSSKITPSISGHLGQSVFGAEHTIEELPLVGWDGSEYCKVLYRVVEKSITYGNNLYEYTVKDASDGKEYTYEFDADSYFKPVYYNLSLPQATNQYDTVFQYNQISTTDLIVTKKWDDHNDPYDLRGDNWTVKFQIQETYDGFDWVNTTVWSVEQSQPEDFIVSVSGKSESATVTIDGLPEAKIASDGVVHSVQYRALEIDENNSVIEGDDNAKYGTTYDVDYYFGTNNTTVINGYGMVSISVTKNWIGTPLANTKIVMKLQYLTDDQTYKDVTVNGQPVQVTLDGTIDQDTSKPYYEDQKWHAVFNDLPERYPNSDLTSGSTKYKVVEVEGSGFKQVGDAKHEGNEFTFTNKVVRSITVKKEWLVNDKNADVGEVTVELTRKVDDQLDENFSLQTKLNVGNGWTYSFDDMDVYDDSGNPYTYLINEKEIANHDLSDYTILIEGSSESGFTISNIGKINISGTKTWKDNSVKEQRPDAVELTLYRSAEGQTKEIVDDVTPVWSNQDSDVWTYTYMDLPYADVEGNIYIYSVEETPLTNDLGEAYASSYDGLNITNTIKGTVDLTINKQWFDNGDIEGLRPEEIVVLLYRHIESDEALTLVNEYCITDSNNWIVRMFADNDQWSYQINGLDKYDENGNEYIYTISEQPVDGYDTTIEQPTESDKDELVAAISNTTDGNLQISKTVSGNRGDANRYFTFEITLDDDTINGIFGQVRFENGVARVTLKHGGTVSMTGLPGNIGYTVVEVEANEDGYITTDSDNTSGVILPSDTVEVNFHNRNHVTGGLIISKYVSGNQGDQNKLFHFTITLDDSTINGQYGQANFTDGKAIVELKHNQSITIQDLPENIGYTVEESEANQDGYTTTITGQSTGKIKPNEVIGVTFTNHKHHDDEKDKGGGGNGSWTPNYPGYQLVLTSDR